MSAARLRAAAALLRERAEAATPGPWAMDRAHRGDLLLTCVTAPEEPTEPGTVVGVTDMVLPGDATYIATVHPGVGRAVADLLDATARAVDLSGAAHHPQAMSITDRALAVADAVLGGER